VCAEMMDFVRATGVLWFGLLAFYGTLILVFAVAWWLIRRKRNRRHENSEGPITRLL